MSKKMDQEQQDYTELLKCEEDIRKIVTSQQQADTEIDGVNLREIINNANIQKPSPHLTKFLGLIDQNTLIQDIDELVNMLKMFLENIELNQNQLNHIYITMGLQPGGTNIGSLQYLTDMLINANKKDFIANPKEDDRLPLNRSVLHYYFMYRYIDAILEVKQQSKYDPYLIKCKLPFQDDVLGLNPIDYFCIYLQNDNHISQWKFLHKNPDPNFFTQQIVENKFIYDLKSRINAMVNGYIINEMTRACEAIQYILDLIQQQQYYNKDKGQPSNEHINEMKRTITEYIQ